jgi:UDP-N-acetylmuramoyl-L-alanyl-D-glutamate--2,6-diaminopimelate ligase
MEVLQTNPFTVLVDYAPEPYSLTATFETISKWKHEKIIHILGSTGGGRDVARRPVLGKLSAKFADVVIVTNEDPYDDDPQEIIDQVAKGAEESLKVLERDLFKILDRRKAIEFAISLCGPGDILLVTGKGSEQKMAVAGGKLIDWDDRTVILDLIKKVS